MFNKLDCVYILKKVTFMLVFRYNIMLLLNFFILATILMSLPGCANDPSIDQDSKHDLEAVRLIDEFVDSSKYPTFSFFTKWLADKELKMNDSGGILASYITTMQKAAPTGRMPLFYRYLLYQYERIKRLNDLLPNPVLNKLLIKNWLLQDSKEQSYFLTALLIPGFNASEAKDVDPLIQEMVKDVVDNHDLYRANDGFGQFVGLIKNTPGPGALEDERSELYTNMLNTVFLPDGKLDSSFDSEIDNLFGSLEKYKQAIDLAFEESKAQKIDGSAPPSQTQSVSVKSSANLVSNPAVVILGVPQKIIVGGGTMLGGLYQAFIYCLFLVESSKLSK